MQPSCLVYDDLRNTEHKTPSGVTYSLSLFPLHRYIAPKVMRPDQINFPSLNKDFFVLKVFITSKFLLSLFVSYVLQFEYLLTINVQFESTILC